MSRLGALGCGLLALGCAGCVQPNTYGTHGVLVESRPAGAEVSLDSRPAGVTPCTLGLERVESHVILVSMPGYHTARAKVPPEVVRDSYLGAGVIDLIRVSGAEPMPDRIAIDLEPVAPGDKPRTIMWEDPDRERRKKDPDAVARSLQPTNP